MEVAWRLASFEWCLSNSALRACCLGRESTLSCARPSSFLRCIEIGMRPAIASIPYVGDVQKAPVIHRAALHCILLRF